METLVLNTLGNDYTEQIKALIKDKEVEIVDTSDMKIVHCMGCLHLLTILFPYEYIKMPTFATWNNLKK